MPTPFMHLRAAHRFLNDPAVPEALRASLSAPEHLGAFLLGNVAPDARVSGGLNRAQTHFFEYQAQVQPHAGTAMLSAYPELQQATGGHRAFIAGYLAHLAMDVTWCEDMLFPHFYQRDWLNQAQRYIMLHVLLVALDERDYRQWAAGFAPALAAAQPAAWMPIMPDATLRQWRDLIAGQICDTCSSATLDVLGNRVTIGGDGIREILQDETQMQAKLWQFIPATLVERVEAAMYRQMLAWVQDYMMERSS